MSIFLIDQAICFAYRTVFKKNKSISIILITILELKIKSAMFNLVKLFAKKASGLKLQKSKINENWMVKKGYRTLYIGTKEKCETYLNQGF